MIDMQEVKRKIVFFIENNGPTLPVKIAKAIEMSPVFASAILSELLKEGKIKTSNMKVGASTLYLLPGQEEKLENYTEFLKTVEKDALNKLKEKKILEDETQEPAIRVALRSIKDFAKPLKRDEKLIWRYAFSSEEEIQNILSPEKEIPEKKEENVPEKEEKTLSEKEGKEEISEKKEEIPEENKKKIEFNTPFDNVPESDFYNEIKKFLHQKEIQITEEIQIEKKEIVLKISIKTTLGNLNFLLIAKDKKSVTTDEISSALQRANYEKMSCIYIIRKEPPKKIQNLIEDNNLIRIEIIR